jgi:protein-tyrosine kinase
MGTIEEIVRRSRGEKPGAVSAGKRSRLEKNPGAEWIAQLPQVPVDPQVLSEHRIVSHLTDPKPESAYQMLRTRALQRMRQNDWKLLMVTSAEQGEGKSLTAVNLAISLARETTLSVVLVDLDLRRSGASRYLGIQGRAGVVEYLEGRAELSEVLCRPAGFERLAIMPNTSMNPNSSELLSSPKMADLIVGALEGAADGRIVICDLPPLLATDDALAFSPLIDALLLVVTESVTSRKSMARAWELIKDLELLGVVINRSTEFDVASYAY